MRHCDPNLHLYPQKNQLAGSASVFVHILCHREYTYFMNNDDWMGRNFFTGGTMSVATCCLFFFL